MLEFFKGKVTKQDWQFVGVVAVIAILLAAGFWFVVRKGQVEDIGELNAQLEALKVEVQRAAEYESKVDDLESVEEQMGKLVDLFQDRLPDDAQLPVLIQTFEGYGRRMGLRVSLKKKETLRERNKRTLIYQVTAEGNYHQIAGFINKLEREQRYIKVSRLDINEEVDGVAEATFELSTFIFEEAPEPEGATT